MDTLMLPLSPRFIVLTICGVATLLLIGIGIVDPKVIPLVVIPVIVFGGLTMLGIHDVLQKDHAVLRNYPISAHIRFLLEEIRPEMRQYFFESEKDGMPFSRDTRAVVYQRAKMVLDKRPFGTQKDVYQEGYEWMHHSVAPRPHAPEQFRITIGGPKIGPRRSNMPGKPACTPRRSTRATSRLGTIIRRSRRPIGSSTARAAPQSFGISAIYTLWPAAIPRRSQATTMLWRHRASQPSRPIY